MKKTFFMLLFLIFCESINCSAQKIAYINILYGEFFIENKYNYQVCFYTDSLTIQCGINNGKIRNLSQNEYSKQIAKLQKKEFERYVQYMYECSGNKQHSPKYVTFLDYNAFVLYADGTSKRYFFPAVCTLEVNNEHLKDYEYFMNNLFLMFKSCFPSLNW